MKICDDVDFYGEALHDARGEYVDIMDEYMSKLGHMSEEEEEEMSKKLARAEEAYETSKDKFFSCFTHEES